MTGTAERLRVAVIGTGAVGGVLGARLAAAGHDVWFMARGASLASLREQGLRVDSVDGDLHLRPVQATDDPSHLGTVDVVLVCVKATQVAAVAPSLRPLLGAHTLVLPTQNGVEASAQLAAALGPEHVGEGVCRVIAALVSPAHVHHSAVTPVLEFGVRSGAPPAPAVEAMLPRVAAAVAGAGLHAVRQPDMGVALWEKFLFIEPIGAVGAAARQPFGPVRTVPETRALVDAALHEVVAVGRAAGVTWPADAVTRTWKRYDGLPADSYTSLARDLMAGRPSEYDAQTGAVVRLGDRLGVPTPVHDVLHALLLPGTMGTGTVLPVRNSGATGS